MLAVVARHHLKRGKVTLHHHTNNMANKDTKTPILGNNSKVANQATKIRTPHTILMPPRAQREIVA